MLEIVMVSIYVAVLMFSAIHVVKSFRSSHHELREEITELRKDISSRIIVTYKVIAGFIRSPILLIALFMLPACMVLSAISTQYSLSVTSRDVGSTGIYALYIRFKTPISVSELEQNLNEIGGMADLYVRYIFDSRIELILDDEKLPIYALVGIPPNKSNKLLGGLQLNDRMLVLGTTKSYNLTVRLFGDEHSLVSLNPEIIERASIFYGTPLLPVEAYLGTKPVTPPSDKVIITTTLTASKLIGYLEPVITDVTVEFGEGGLEGVNVTRISELIKRYNGVAMILRNNVLETLSGYGLPTTESLISALISALISSIILLVTFIALQPRVRLIYSRLGAVGLQPWNLTTMLTIFVGVLVLVIGTVSLALIHHVFGIYSALNSFITFSISTLIVVLLINKKVFNVSIVEVVPTPASTKFNLIIKGRDMCKILQHLSELLRGEEFFELRDLDMRCEASGGFLHASCRFRASWGIGVDLDVFTGLSGDGNVELSFNISVWSIEELSTSQLESILRLFESKLLGGLEVWVLSQAA
ncbi:MAG: hypothetical protein RMH77_06430 [Sulfolobales archaeon]|nr:hypothetical protein [Sulfolobales archaeon]MDW7970018.1 hypothetical protein [Sulfolobales archaeon]